MGDFRIVIEAMGGHGCQREAKQGEAFVGCGHENCPDCMARVFVDQLKVRGFQIFKATFTHWPFDTVRKDGEKAYQNDIEIVDDMNFPYPRVLRTKGQFRKG